MLLAMGPPVLLAMGGPVLLAMGGPVLLAMGGPVLLAMGRLAISSRAVGLGSVQLLLLQMRGGVRMAGAGRGRLLRPWVL